MVRNSEKLILTKTTLTASSVVRAPQQIQAINASDESAKLVGFAPGTASMPDGEYKLGSHTVSKCLDGVRLDRSLHLTDVMVEGETIDFKNA